HHEGDHGLAEVGMGDTDDGAFADPRDFVDKALNLFWVDVIAAGDDEVLGAADDAVIAILIAAGHIAGDKKAIGAEFFRRFLRHPPVALEDVGPPDPKYADFAVRHHAACVIDDARLVIEGKADRAGFAKSVIGVGGDHAGFRHAVAL